MICARHADSSALNSLLLTDIFLTIDDVDALFRSIQAPATHVVYLTFLAFFQDRVGNRCVYILRCESYPMFVAVLRSIPEFKATSRYNQRVVSASLKCLLRCDGYLGF